jgi:peptidoglycan/LPS O-acetylase OafA/YrhL
MGFLKLDFAYIHQTYIKPLDGLRGGAILLVIFFHNFDYLYVSGLGWVGVDLFFVLSGFLITRILLRAKEHPRYFLNFYVKRTLRIFPLYYLFVLGCFFMVQWVDIERLNPVKDYLGYFVTYTPNFLFYRLDGFIPRFAMGHLWSLAVEEHFYLLWPFVVYISKNQRLIYISLLAILGSCLLGVGMLNHHSWMVMYTFTFSRLSTILLGSLLAIVLLKHRVFLQNLMAPLIFITGTCIAGFYAKLYFINQVPLDFFLFHPSTTIAHSHGIMLLVFGLFFTALVGFTLSKNRLSALFSFKPLVWLGKYSYGIYVFHFPVYFLCRDYVGHFLGSPLSAGLTGRLLVSVICVLITLTISVLSYHLFEMRFLRLKKKFETAQE